jgi:hypothetical protein
VDLVGALVDAGRVGIVQDAVGAGQGGARQHHELQLRRQVVGGGDGDRPAAADEHGAAAALRHQVEAVVEELAEEHEPQVERRRQALVGGRVLEREKDDVVGRQGGLVYVDLAADDGDAVVELVVVGAPDQVGAGAAGNRHGRRVVAGLVGNQVGDDARVGVHHIAADAIVRVGDHASRPEVDRVAVLVVAEERIEQARKQLVGGAEVLVARGQVVEGPVDGAQPEGHERVGNEVGQVGARSMLLGDQDLLENELEIGPDIGDGHCYASSPRDRRLRQQLGRR